ncbi:MAG TPA: hypothetical protein DEB73_01270 [Candidatus Magasanikbacteria bacterium]|uniref:Uncharacterized protein n=2 Tax=Candidatus Magasanikiibacteriota TaxID=1752731 RepID=A0A0G0ZHW0_9BACT|nr:MAG: hypothetical protein UU49_C0040G0006 [Candidatus Magasanikbacteria bacterium GW2011_GWC2_41_17]KKS12588.1 MAG: hypothetical protein UU69_C0030G0010 [Candidatus Magasanikbacteria bacterium GW2011_GWA2_41_55]HBV57881.1 hypothetical protein [Candidatus Magasanikbacteria bacterium]HBX16480.1 hypothetical protein [Candidatus Magasanikbacteria bacterium]
MSKTKYIFSSFVLFLFSASAVLADAYGLDDTAGKAGIPTKGSITLKIGTIVGAALSFVGIFFLGLMLYAGFLWMNARGKQEQADKAQDIIVDACIGLAITGAAYIITKFVFQAMGI